MQDQIKAIEVSQVASWSLCSTAVNHIEGNRTASQLGKCASMTGWLWFLEVAGCHWLSLAEGGAASKMYWHLPQLLLLFYARYLGDMA